MAQALQKEDQEVLSPAPALAQFERIEEASIDRILQAVRDHLGTEIAYVARYVGENERELMHVNTDLELPMGPGYRDPKANSYCWHILEGRLPQLIRDPADHPFTQDIAITHLLPVGAHLNVPLKLSDGTVYGSFCCLSRQPDRSMGERDLDVLKAFAALAAEQIERTLEESERHSVLSSSIRNVIDQQSVTILHQPIVDLKTGAQVGVECLARFPDAQERGPDRWFSDASEIGLGVELEMLAIRRALATAEHLPKSIYLALNASPETVLSGEIERLLADHRGNEVLVEVTEHHRVEDFSAIKAALSRISKYASVAIDDVGAGYSGLRHMIELGPDVLKLDMSLTRDVDRDVARQALTAAMVRFGAEIGSKLVAEGIETEEERAMMAELGVDYGQGYHFARPMPVVASAQTAMETLMRSAG